MTAPKRQVRHDELQHDLSEREVEILRLLADGMSDREIGERLVMTINTVKWYNRQIYSKLGVGSRTQAIALANTLGLLTDPPFGSAFNDPANGAPNDVLTHIDHRLKGTFPAQTTSFIGRSREVADIKRLLNSTRLLTLTGTGGIGKTRLALQVATEVADDFPDGVYFVDLAPVADDALVATTIATALGVVENTREPLLQTLKRALAQEKLLLLLDNFEHVMQAAPVVAGLLAASAHLKVLVTSRESLRLSGEQAYPLAPLSLPEGDSLSVSDLIASEAGALFVQRARMTHPHFEVNEANVQTIARICARLDGLPLALELAAARSKLLSPQALLERLEGETDDSPLRALGGGWRDAPPRQRTMRDSIEWSYHLLSPGEKMLFARLAVFRGGRSLEAIEAVCGPTLPIDVFDGLASLVDKSLTQQKATAGTTRSAGPEPEHEPRFALLEMIHEFALERLEAGDGGDEADAFWRRHAEYFVALAERAEPELRLAQYDEWCDRFELELDNIRAVLEWTLSAGEVTLAVRLATAISQFWYGKGYHVEAVRWLEQLLARLDDVPVAYHPKFLVSAGQLMFVKDLDAARRLLDRALDCARELGDTLQQAWALTFIGYATHHNPQAAMPLVEEALALFLELKHLPGMAQTLNIAGEITRLDGDDARARHIYEECLSVCRQTGEVRRICYLYHNLAFIAQHEGNYRRAARLGRQSLRLACSRQARRDMAMGLATLAGGISKLGQAENAARFLGVAESTVERMGAFDLPSDRPEIERIAAEVRAQLGEAAFRSAWAEGRRMTLEQAVSEALS